MSNNEELAELVDDFADLTEAFIDAVITLDKWINFPFFVNDKQLAVASETIRDACDIKEGADEFHEFNKIIKKHDPQGWYKKFQTACVELDFSNLVTKEDVGKLKEAATALYKEYLRLAKKVEE